MALTKTIYAALHFPDHGAMERIGKIGVKTLCPAGAAGQGRKILTTTATGSGDFGLKWASQRRYRRFFGRAAIQGGVQLAPLRLPRAFFSRRLL
jgi:hypothetical protein